MSATPALSPSRDPVYGFERSAGPLQAAAVAVAILAGVATAATGLGSGLERTLHATAAALSPRAASGRVALVEIDARSLADQPRWPWPRGVPELTLHVFGCVLRDLETWAAQGLHLSAAVNVSALLPADAEFMRALAALLASASTPASRITGEVTESAALAYPERAADALRRLTALGVRVSIDDYGAGQSTLSYLRNLPASEIKIDKSFVTDLASSRSDQAMVRSTIDLAHQLGLEVVAEGVETREVLDLLRSYGCDGAQGWLIGRPTPAPDLAGLLTLRPRAA